MAAAPTVLVNGGELAATEAHRRLADGHVVDRCRRLGQGRGRARRRTGTLRASGRLRVIPVTVDESGLAAAIETRSPIETPIESPIEETGSEGGSDDKPAG